MRFVPFLVLTGALSCMGLGFILSSNLALPDRRAQPADTTFASFVESDFPFITTTIDGDTLASYVPSYNWAVRGVVVQLGDSTYYVFDPDLLRMSLAWKGDFITMKTMAMVSYHTVDKGNAQPRVQGEPIVGTGMYPGWMGADVSWNDPREPAQDAGNPGRGPLPETYGRYRGLYVSGDEVTFSYEIRGTRVFERPGRVEAAGMPVITRTLLLSAVDEDLHLIAGEVPHADVVAGAANEVVFAHGGSDSVTVFRLDVSAGGARAPAGRIPASLEAADDRYAVVRLVPRRAPQQIRVSAWTGPASGLPAFRKALDAAPVEMSVDFAGGGAGRWDEAVRTSAHTAPDTSAFVYDDLELPLPNPWRRNVRPADIAFFSDGRAAVITFDGDVWIVEGIAGTSPVWTRFASGLFEPLSLVVVDDVVIAYGREGLVRLHDYNEDGEADFYEAFAPGIAQSTRTREWPFSVVVRPGGGFFVSQGGALHSGSTRHLEPVMRGFLGGSNYNGTVLAVSPDGREVEVFASGFRGPYIGVHPRTGAVTASDQQGNFVPTTPVYAVHERGYYGVPATAHRPEPLPEPVPPITWIPHQVDPSGTHQLWPFSKRLGPLDGALLHVSYGRPGFLRVYIDSAAVPLQGGIVPLPYPDDTPLLKAALNPGDGFLYTVGFRIYGSDAERLAGMRRMRYTGLHHALPKAVQAGRQGILLAFDEALREPQAGDFQVRRWNYKRTEAYGSGHYRLDGSEGEERMTVAGVHLSSDRRSVLVVVPDMQEVMTLAVDFRLTGADGDLISNAAYLTVNDVHELDLQAYGLERAPWQRDLEAPAPALAVEATPPVEATAEKGQDLYQELGCAGCHSTDGTQGNFGPTFAGLFGSRRLLEGGRTRIADEDYLRNSILDPGEEIVEGFGAEMPSFRGILSPEDIDAIVLYIKTLSVDPGTE